MPQRKKSPSTAIMAGDDTSLVPQHDKMTQTEPPLSSIEHQEALIAEHRFVWFLLTSRKTNYLNMKTYFKIRMLLLSLVLLLVACAYSSNRKAVNRQTVEKLNLQEFMGTWYEIARFDHSFERGMTDVTATYRLLDNGKIEVINSGLRNGKREEAIGKVKTTATPGRLRVSFFWIFYSDYNILAMGDDGQWALIGSSSPKYLWILARTPQLVPATLNHIIELAKTLGYNTEKLIIDKD